MQSLADLRGGEDTLVETVVIEGSPSESVARVRATGGGEPLGVVAHDEEAVFAAIAAGADDACLAKGLDLHRFIAFLDRVALRARQRRETENRQAAVAHAEKLAALGTVVAGVAHEINNPLGLIILVNESIRSTLEPLLRVQQEIFRLAERGGPATADEVEWLSRMAQTGSTGGELRGSLDDVQAALRTITEIVRDLRIFGRADAEESPEPIFLPDLVGQALRIVGKQITAVATLERDYAPDLPLLLLPRGRLAQVLTNLLINAAQAIAEVKRPMHRVRISMRCDDEALALSISDTGPGIPPDVIERIFDPFFTTKRGEATTGGTGLGLSISRSILQALGGDLIVESVHGAGATFIAIIPTEGRRVSGQPRRDVAAGRLTSPPPRVSVLVVDDEEPLLRTLASALRGRFDVMLAGDGQEAIDLLASGSRPDVILCDVAMPVVDGPALYEWLLSNRPELARKTVFITADGASASADVAVRTERMLLEKPITRERLIAALDSIVADP